MACRWSAAEVLYFHMKATGVTGDLGRGVVTGLQSSNSGCKETKAAVATTRLGTMSNCTAIRKMVFGLEEVKATGVSGQRSKYVPQELVSADLG
jgi:hypothetical protein